MSNTQVILQIFKQTGLTPKLAEKYKIVTLFCKRIEMVSISSYSDI